MFPDGDFRDFYFRGDRKQQVVEHVDALRRISPRRQSWPIPPCASASSHPAVSSVIPGMRTVRHAESNTALSDQPELSRRNPGDTCAATPGTATSIAEASTLNCTKNGFPCSGAHNASGVV